MLDGGVVIADALVLGTVGIDVCNDVGRFEEEGEVVIFCGFGKKFLNPK